MGTYDNDLTDDQIAYVHERADARRKIWGEHMRTIETPASPRARVLGFIEAFRRAPNDADIEISLGMDEAQQPALLISIGRSNHCLLVTEARKVADIMEEAMRANPNDPEARTLPNTIMGIRAACKKADRGFAANSP